MLALACALVGGAATTGAALVQQDTVRERSYFEAIDRLDIDSGPALVTVRAGGTDRVIVTERVGWSLRKPTVNEQIEGDTLSVSVDCLAASRLFGCAVVLEIQVPAATAVKSRSGSGRTEILDISGDTSAETGSGQIELSRVSGAIWAKSGSGQIIGTGLTSTETRAFSSSGQVTLQYDRPPTSVTARLASGNLVLQVPDDRSQYRIGLSNAGGDQVIDQSLPTRPRRGCSTSSPPPAPSPSTGWATATDRAPRRCRHGGPRSRSASIPAASDRPLLIVRARVVRARAGLSDWGGRPARPVGENGESGTPAVGALPV
ncbi:hypothetical protein [Kitasatospora sp. CB02891]|uniref:hypothetical protein n=1 Tax=Kitasatospora sp. CB02891 TaxID=2020329 RepID=UPI000C26DF33|nr:hypothetical protein [Kitasatospora sp. CB02891]PJN26837.1 hypothetical protein CG736_09475 [Kitasatospora sp. CB02891]